MNAPNAPQTVPEPLPIPDRESQIAAGTVTLTAAELAPRLGYKGKRGVEKIRALAAAKVIPSFRPGRAYRFHWPTVVDAIHKPGKSRPRIL